MRDRKEPCGLCGHTLADHDNILPILGGHANDVELCHQDDHSCYHEWTVYGRRPGDGPITWKTTAVPW